MAKKYGGYAGYGMRVNLTTGKITLEDTIERFLDYIGGTAIGYKVLWDEVPAGTKPFSPENKLVYATGPLAGTGALCAGRSVVTSIMPFIWPQPLMASAHIGGNLAAKLKYAGLDYLIVEGKSERPVYLHIANRKGTICEAKHIWGQGIRRTAEIISREIGPDNCVAAIGPAGEKMINMSTMQTSMGHSAGAGVGAIMGSKNLKALALQGDLPVHIAGDIEEWERTVNHHRSIIGCNNQGVVPSFPSPLFEYSWPGSRWIGAPGKRWGAADPPVELTKDIRSLNRISYRTNNAAYFLGDSAWKYTVRTNGCHSCPVRCYTVLKDSKAAGKYGIREVLQNTCISVCYGASFMPILEKDPDGAREASMVAMDLMDNLGIWCNYGQLTRDFVYMREHGIFEKHLGSDEYKSIDWKKMDVGDPTLLQDILPRIAYKQGEFGTVMGMGVGYALEHWGIPESRWGGDIATLYWKFGHPKHHANEDDGQVGVVINTQYNRDPICHSHSNFVRSGLPIHEQKRLAEMYWGSADAVDANGDYRPTNKFKMIRAKWSIERKELHDMLGLCNWMGPWITSPIKEDKYVGDNALESKYYSIATGHKISMEDLDKHAERAFTLHRAQTIRDMRDKNMRVKHDKYPEWIFKDPNNKPAFSAGTIRMDKDDIEESLDLFYEVMNWDKVTGAPKVEAYRNLGLNSVADEMQKKQLVP